MRADGFLFDKDGTLFDFAGMWNAWAHGAIIDFAEDDHDISMRVADAIDYDMTARRFLPHSAVIAGTSRQAAEAISDALPGSDVDEIERTLMYSAANAPLVEAVPLDPFLRKLLDRGLRLGVMTNDSEYAARAHLDGVGVTAHFDFIAGCDSGFGAKPDAAPLLAFADNTGLVPDRVVMVGDSTHDLVAGRAAGMQTIAVLTGVAEADELAPYADAVLPDIGHIPAWLDA